MKMEPLAIHAPAQDSLVGPGANHPAKPRRGFGKVNPLDPRHARWSLEGRAVTVEKAYLRGGLKGSTNAETAPDLPEGYTKAAKGVAERQAGRRAIPAVRLHRAISSPPLRQMREACGPGQRG